MKLSSPLLHKKQAGFNMVEVLVAMAISATLLAGILQIFLSNKQTYNSIKALSGLQENARFAIVLLSQAIRGSDNWACLEDRTKVTGSTYTAGLSAGTDVIKVAGTYAASVTVTSASNANVVLNDSSRFKVGDDVLVSDCAQGEIMTVNAITNGTALTLTGNLTNSYSSDATIQKLKTSTFYITYLDRDTGAVCSTQAWSSACIPNLILDDGSGTAYGLVEGVEQIQFTYGEELSNGNIFFTNNPSDLTAVKVVKMSLLMTTIDEVASKSLSYTFNGSPTTADRRIRKVFNATIALRNRL